MSYVKKIVRFVFILVEDGGGCTNEYAKDSNGNVIETTTNSEGFYALTKVTKGQYLVVFEGEHILHRQ